MNTEELSCMLAADVASPPPSTVDVEAAVRNAYQTRRRRLVVAAGAAVAALLVGAGVVGVTATGGSTHRVRPAATATRMPVAPDSFDPTVRTLSVGFLPPGFSAPTYEVDAQGQSLRVSHRDVATGGSSDLLVTVYPSGSKVGAGLAGQGRKGPAVHGLAARCIGRAGHRCETLAFKYLPGAWAKVNYQPPPSDTAPASTARRVAAAVRLVDPTPMTAPFHLTGQLAHWTPVGAVLDRGSTMGRVSLDRPGRSGRHSVASVDISVRANDPARERPNTTVGGHPAALSTNADGTVILVVYRSAGTSVCIQLAPRERVDPREVYRAVQLVRQVDDPTTWVAPL